MAFRLVSTVREVRNGIKTSTSFSKIVAVSEMNGGDLGRLVSFYCKWNERWNSNKSKSRIKNTRFLECCLWLLGTHLKKL